MTIKVIIKNIYGNNLIYPVCEKAMLFAAIAGQKTLTQATIAKIKGLGFDVLVEQQQL